MALGEVSNLFSSMSSLRKLSHIIRENYYWNQKNIEVWL